MADTNCIPSGTDQPSIPSTRSLLIDQKNSNQTMKKDLWKKVANSLKTPDSTTSLLKLNFSDADDESLNELPPAMKKQKKYHVEKTNASKGMVQKKSALKSTD